MLIDAYMYLAAEQLLHACKWPIDRKCRLCWWQWRTVANSLNYYSSCIQPISVFIIFFLRYPFPVNCVNNYDL